MVLILIVTCWTLIALLALSLCLAARDGDRQQRGQAPSARPRAMDARRLAPGTAREQPRHAL